MEAHINAPLSSIKLSVSLFGILGGEVGGVLVEAVTLTKQGLSGVSINLAGLAALHSIASTVFSTALASLSLIFKSFYNIIHYLISKSILQANDIN